MLNLMPLSNRNTNIFQYLEDMEKNFWNGFHSDFPQFKTDIEETEENYILKADLPGFNKEEIQLEIKDNILEISAEHTEESEQSENNFVRRERHFGSFKRSFDVSNINTDGIEASYNNGVLELVLPKLELQQPAPLKIEVK